MFFGKMYFLQKRKTELDLILDSLTWQQLKSIKVLIRKEYKINNELDKLLAGTDIPLLL